MPNPDRIEQQAFDLGVEVRRQHEIERAAELENVVLVLIVAISILIGVILWSAL